MIDVRKDGKNSPNPNDWNFTSIQFFQEISVLSQCRCPYITEYYGSFLNQTKLWIIMEYMAGGSVADLVGYFYLFLLFSVWKLKLMFFRNHMYLKLQLLVLKLCVIHFNFILCVIKQKINWPRRLPGVRGIRKSLEKMLCTKRKQMNNQERKFLQSGCNLKWRYRHRHSEYGRTSQGEREWLSTESPGSDSIGSLREGDLLPYPVFFGLPWTKETNA
jgi:hypothetical protein